MSTFDKLQAKPEQSETQQSGAQRLVSNNRRSNRALSNPNRLMRLGKRKHLPWRLRPTRRVVSSGLNSHTNSVLSLHDKRQRQPQRRMQATTRRGLRTLETILHKKNHIHETQLEMRQDAWRRAAASDAAW